MAGYMHKQAKILNFVCSFPSWHGLQSCLSWQCLSLMGRGSLQSSAAGMSGQHHTDWPTDSRSWLQHLGFIHIWYWPFWLLYNHCLHSFTKAPGEADAELARLNKASLIDAVLTDDGDCFVFGAERVIHKWVTFSYFIYNIHVHDIAQSQHEGRWWQCHNLQCSLNCKQPRYRTDRRRYGSYCPSCRGRL